MDRFGGSLLLAGDVASVEASLAAITDFFGAVLKYAVADITRT